MNYKQRIVLIMGALAFLYLLFTSPKISIVKGTYIIPPPDKKEVARVVDIYTAMTRAVAVLGATLLVCLALKDRKRTRVQSQMDTEPCLDGYCQENERRLAKKDVITKILAFLKEFF